MAVEDKRRNRKMTADHAAWLAHQQFPALCCSILHLTSHHNINLFTCSGYNGFSFVEIHIHSVPLVVWRIRACLVQYLTCRESHNSLY